LMGIPAPACSANEASVNLAFFTKTRQRLDVRGRAGGFQIICKISTLRARR
jgi:hypothetical protein